MRGQGALLTPVAAHDPGVVVPRARGYYERLGFRDYNRNRNYPFLLEERERIRGLMRAAAEKNNMLEIERLGNLQQTLNDEASNATMYVAVATMKLNARRNWEATWLKVGEGHYEKITIP